MNTLWKGRREKMVAGTEEGGSRKWRKVDGSRRYIEEV